MSSSCLHWHFRNKRHLSPISKLFNITKKTKVLFSSKVEVKNIWMIFRRFLITHFLWTLMFSLSFHFISFETGRSQSDHAF